MSLKFAFAVALTTLTVGGAVVRAQQATAPATAPTPTSGAVISSSNLPVLDFGTHALTVIPPPGTSESLSALLANGQAAAARSGNAQPVDGKQDAGHWNCGMPVVQPPTDIDPAFERKPDDRLAVPIRRALPRACGR